MKYIISLFFLLVFVLGITPVYADVVKSQLVKNVSTGLINNDAFGTSEITVTGFTGQFRYLRVYGITQSGATSVSANVSNCTSLCTDLISYTAYEVKQGTDSSITAGSAEYFDIDLGYTFNSTTTANVYIIQVYANTAKDLDLYGTSSGSQTCKYINGYPTVTNCPNVKSIYYQLSDNSGFSDDDETGTRIISLTPVHNSTTSSPVSFLVNYYVDEDDIGGSVNQLKLSVRVSHVDQPADDDLFADVGIDLDISGYGSYATTTTASNGTYLFRADISKRIFGLIQGWQFDNETSIFAVGAHSTYGQIFLNNSNFINAPASSTIAYVWDTCITDLINCAVHLVVPTSQQWLVLYDSISSSITSKAPLGYVSIMASALISSSTSALSNVTLTIPPGLPHAGSQVEVVNWYDDFGTTSPLSTYVSTSTSKTFWQIVSTPIDTILYLLTGISAMFMLVKFRP